MLKYPGMRQQLDAVSGLEIHKATLFFMEDAVNDLTFFYYYSNYYALKKNKKSKIKVPFRGRC